MKKYILRSFGLRLWRRSLHSDVIDLQRRGGRALQISQSLAVVRFGLELVGARGRQFILSLEQQESRRAAHVVKLLLSFKLLLGTFPREARSDDSLLGGAD